MYPLYSRLFWSRGGIAPNTAPSFTSQSLIVPDRVQSSEDSSPGKGPAADKAAKKSKEKNVNVKKKKEKKSKKSKKSKKEAEDDDDIPDSEHSPLGGKGDDDDDDDNFQDLEGLSALLKVDEGGAKKRPASKDGPKKKPATQKKHNEALEQAWNFSGLAYFAIRLPL